MCSVLSRMAVYWKRTMEGIDTHRDDIGTFKERQNRRKIVGGRSEVKITKRQMDFKFKDIDDILMTLLEDGKIDIDEYLTRQQDLLNRMKQHDIDTLPKQFGTALRGRDREDAKKKKIIQRLQLKVLEKQITSRDTVVE